jgi:enamine deaminase RidA (YjgF/YER057c/UK114 family)
MLSLMLCTFLAAPPRGIESDPKTGKSRAVVVEDARLVHTGQVFPSGPTFAPTPPAEQVSQAFSRLRDVLLAAGTGQNEVVKLNVYVRHPSVTPLVEQELARRYAGTYQPAVSFVQTALPDDSVLIGVDAVALCKPAEANAVEFGKPTDKTQPARWAVLPTGSVAYIAGQAEKGDGSLADATKQTMVSLFRTLEFLNCQPADVVHIKAFLTPMSQYSVAMKELVAPFGDGPCPPVSLVEWVSSTPIEIELVVAARSANSAPRLEFLTPPGMTASPVYARVVRVNAPQRIYVSGLYGTTETPNAAEEIRDLFAGLTRTLEAAGSDLKHLAKATYYVADPEPSRLLNVLRPEYYDPKRPPSAAKAQVVGTGRPPRSITLDMIAVPKE